MAVNINLVQDLTIALVDKSIEVMEGAEHQDDAAGLATVLAALTDFTSGIIARLVTEFDYDPERLYQTGDRALRLSTAHHIAELRNTDPNVN